MTIMVLLSLLLLLYYHIVVLFAKVMLLENTLERLGLSAEDKGTRSNLMRGFLYQRFDNLRFKQ